MLEIDKQKERFSDKSVKELAKDYDRNFLQTPKEEKPSPKSPYPEDDKGQLPLKKRATPNKKSD
jgi:hypothetical protein